MIVEDSPETVAFLEHYGVPGMKWGVRKDSKGRARKNARKELMKVSSSARKSIKDYGKASDSAGRKSAADAYKTEVLDVIKSKKFREDYRKANSMGKGEMATHILFMGPLAAVTIPQAKQGYANRALTGASQEREAAQNLLREMRKNT